jgi:hypothetical protein
LVGLVESIPARLNGSSSVGHSHGGRLGGVRVVGLEGYHDTIAFLRGIDADVGDADHVADNAVVDGLCCQNLGQCHLRSS